MAKRKVQQVKDTPELPPQIIVTLGERLEVELKNWRHNAPTKLLYRLDIDVNRAIHQWRTKHTVAETRMGTPNNREQEAALERR